MAHTADFFHAEKGFRVGPSGVEVVDAGGHLPDANPKLTVRAGEAITAGQLVYISGFHAGTGLLTVHKADADAAAPANAAQFIAPSDIGSGETGVVVGMALVTGIDTDSESVGDNVYLSTTAGGWTDTAPTGGGHTVQSLGVVTVSDSSDGAILFFPFYSKATSVNTTG